MCWYNGVGTCGIGTLENDSSYEFWKKIFIDLDCSSTSSDLLNINIRK